MIKRLTGRSDAATLERSSRDGQRAFLTECCVEFITKYDSSGRIPTPEETLQYLMHFQLLDLAAWCGECGCHPATLEMQLLDGDTSVARALGRHHRDHKH